MDLYSIMDKHSICMFTTDYKDIHMKGDNWYKHVLLPQNFNKKKRNRN